MLNLFRKVVLLMLTGSILAGGSSLSRASVGFPATNSEASGSTTQPEAIAANQLICTAQVLAIMAEALKQASMADATVANGTEPTTSPVSDQTIPTVWGM